MKLPDNIISRQQAMVFGFHHKPSICSFAIDDQPIRYVAILLQPHIYVKNFQSKQRFLAFNLSSVCWWKKRYHVSAQPDEIERYRHLLQVLLDQLLHAPKHQHYLPQSHHVVLKPILEFLARSEHFVLSLQQCLSQFSLSERQLLRLSQTELNMSLAEWRNRAKIVYAIQKLENGCLY